MASGSNIIKTHSFTSPVTGGSRVAHIRKAWATGSKQLPARVANVYAFKDEVGESLVAALNSELAALAGIIPVEFCTLSELKALARDLDLYAKRIAEGSDDAADVLGYAPLTDRISKEKKNDNG